MAGASEPASYDWTVAGASDTVGGIQAFFNVDTASPIDVENGQATASALDHATPSVTTTVANATLVASHTFASARTWIPPPGLGDAFDRQTVGTAPAGQSIQGSYGLQVAAGPTGTKTATAAGDADAGNTHILALRPTGALPTLDKPAGTLENDVLIASIGITPSTATITAPSGWTLIRRIDNASATSNSLAIYRKVAGAAEPAAYAWGFSGADFAVGGIQAFFNVDTASPIDVEDGQATPSATTHATPSVTTTVANAMLVTSHTFASARTWTPPTGMSESFDRPNGANSAIGQSITGNRVLQPEAGASGTKTATASANADVGNTHILALKPGSPALTINTPAGTLANDMMIASIGITPSTASITAPAGWNLIRRIDNASATSNSLALYRKVAGASEPASHAWTLTGASDTVGGIQAFFNVDTVTPIDVEDGVATASALTHATPSVTTSLPNTLLVTSHGLASAATWTPPAGMTEGFDIATPAPPNAAGLAIEGNWVAQAGVGATGIKTATAANDADVGTAHILALRPFVNSAPTVSLTSPANNAVFTAPASIVLTADAQDSDGTVNQVEFFQGATLVATDTTAPFTFTLTNVAAGSYTFTARATDNGGASTTSAAVNVTVNTGVAQMYFIHTDHLNTPRLITNQTGQAVWRYDNNDPFGGNVPDENPSGLGAFTCNLRMPGQYFDKETNTHYNYFRDYDPSIGRYIESDPIGLEGGINTYLYAIDPLTQIDPLGLMGQGAGANYPGPRVPPPPGPTCEGTWEPLIEIPAPPPFTTFFCKCRWVCRSCTGAYTGKTVDNLGVPSGQQWNRPQAQTERRRGLPPRQRPIPGDPTGCACARPAGEKPCVCP